jgi:queuosine precursor transporter
MVDPLEHLLAGPSAPKSQTMPTDPVGLSSPVLTILLANYAITHWGKHRLPRRALHGARLARASTHPRGAVSRVRVHVPGPTQEWLGRKAVIVAILVGALLSWAATSNRDLAVASAVAFLFSELADFAVYQPLRERRWLLAVFASNAVGLGIDSILFPQIAFGSLHFIEGQIIEKLWTTVFAVVVLLALRRWVIPRYSRPADKPTVPEVA